MYKPRPYQTDAKEAIKEKFATHQSTVAVLPTGCGKCLGRGTPVLLFSGHVIPVEEVVVGDFLMGPDSTPREVMSVCRGSEQLYQITPTKGDPYVVNESHILSLVRTTEKTTPTYPCQRRGGELVDVSVTEYIKKSKWWKHIHKGYRVGVEFTNNNTLLIDPYFLGVWLGDGNSRLPMITTGDQEVVVALDRYARQLGMTTKKIINSPGSSNIFIQGKKRTGRGGTLLRSLLKEYGLLLNKHIPHEYKTASRNVRLSVLAGIIDTDGYLARGCYDITLKSERLFDDVVFVARSLGFACYKKSCTKTCTNNGVTGNYWRCSISGNIGEIPCKIKRKKAPIRKQKKSVLCTGLRVSPIGVGEYFGFELKGNDRRFLLGDFTVTHNTILFSLLADEYRKHGRVMVLAHREELIEQAADKISKVTGIPVEIEMADQRASQIIKSPIVVSSIQTQTAGGANPRMEQFDPMEFSLVIADECFPGSCLVDGRRIDSITVGDSVRTHLGDGKVLKVFSRTIDRIVRVVFDSGKELVCTPGHPISTDHGFFCAASLTEGSMVHTITQHEKQMRNLRDDNTERNQFETEKNLRIEHMPVGVFQEKNQKDISSARRRHNKVQKNKWDARSCHKSEGIRQVESDGVGANGSQGQWARPNHARKANCLRLGLGLRSSSEDENAEGERIPDELQTRRCERGSESRHRNRRVVSQSNRKKGSGQEKRRVHGFDRVARVEVYERGSGEEFGRLCPEGVVYNLHVSNGNTYYANGFLVHNCHHSAADTWRSALQHYGSNPNCKMLGVTATPRRTDQKALACVFDTVAFRMGLADGIKEGWLVGIEQKYVRIEGLKYKEIGVSRGDFVQVELAAEMKAPLAVEAVCAATLEIAGRKKSLVFCTDIEHAVMVTSMLNQFEPGYAHLVTGQTPSMERRHLISEYRADKYPCLVNVGIATEGFDVAGIEVVVMARPTKSALLYEQMLGRGTRTTADVDSASTAAERIRRIAASSKPHMTVVDFVGNSTAHEIVTVIDVLGGNMPGEVIEAASSKLTSGGGGDVMSAISDAMLQHKQKTKDSKAVYKESKVDPFRGRLSPYNVFKIEREIGTQPVEAWQKEKLEKWRMPVPSTAEEAQDLIDEVRRRTREGLCTYRMASMLNSWGYDGASTTFEKAKEIINERSERQRWRA